jgi:photosystem II stability/assembly factor-like uncharacterized protein
MNWPNFRNSICLFIAFSCLLLSCKKEKAGDLQPSAIYILEDGVRINGIQMLSDSVWLACGGIRNEYGVIYKSYNAGSSWKKVFTTNESSIYSIELNEQHKGLAGGDFLRMWQTNDAGETWHFYWLADQVPINEEDRPAIRDIQFVSDSTWYFCGGENLYKGVFYHTENAGATWDFLSIEHELRSVVPISKYVIATTGHGGAFTWNQQSSNLERSDFKNDFMMDATLLGNGDLLACTEQGNVYRSKSGSYWERIWKASRINYSSWNGIAQRANDVLAVGNYGKILLGSAGGSEWREYALTDVGHLLAVEVWNKRFYIPTSDGRLLVLDKF